MKLTNEEIVFWLAKPYKLTKKEQRLLAYDLGKKDGERRTIGDACQALKTTPMTLFKTRESLKNKLIRPLDELLNEQREERRKNGNRKA